ncbi:hypothetical protein [Herbaspirillum sp. alder98]|uniref:hypothetical protein n=1 Tax=Herbaspirillum sp. alder98 TaxID=2913096 RepID=UPI001CD87BCC|nr:hypothetical protein [Herbaspirillum sp. alder98]MCA1322890.1 hypothetical protein [Herbaspirillum sp. alder98]
MFLLLSRWDSWLNARDAVIARIYLQNYSADFIKASAEKDYRGLSSNMGIVTKIGYCGENNKLNNEKGLQSLGGLLYSGGASQIRTVDLRIKSQIKHAYHHTELLVVTTFFITSDYLCVLKMTQSFRQNSGTLGVS